MEDYWIWLYATNEDDAIITKVPEEFESNKWKLCEGISCTDWFPHEVNFELDPNRGKVINDAIHNVLGLHIVSEKLKSILAESGADFEFFPVNIKNHKGKLLKEQYYLANLVGKLACVDRELSECEQDSFEEDQLSYYEKMVLDTDKIPEGTNIFRLAETPRLLIASDAFSDLIKIEKECTGPSFCLTEEWDGYGG